MASAQPQKDDKPVGPASGNDAGKPEDATKKSPTALEEDDEFEDFPVEGALIFLLEPSPPFLASSHDPSGVRCKMWLTWQTKTDWPAEETEAANGGETTKHLWEESWDDDDTSDDFSKQLKYARPPPPLPPSPLPEPSPAQFISPVQTACSRDTETLFY